MTTPSERKTRNSGTNSAHRLLTALLAMKVRTSTLLLLLFLGVRPLVAQAGDCTKPSALPPSETGQPHNLGGLKNQLLYYECSGEYFREIKRQIDKAISYVTKHAKDRINPAIVLDIDETSLSNWDEMKANDFGLIETGPCTLSETDPTLGPEVVKWPKPKSPCGFNAWILLADAKNLDTLRLFQAAKEKNVAVFFISARQEETRVLEATIDNLHKAGYTDWTGLYLKPSDDKESIQEFKTAKRKQIRTRYTILANVGDQYSDLRGGYAERFYKLPNPFYFVP
jgi:HAD superfamily, subfamily IIIB (Acid phosphatase)